MFRKKIELSLRGVEMTSSDRFINKAQQPTSPLRKTVPERITFFVSLADAYVKDEPTTFCHRLSGSSIVSSNGAVVFIIASGTVRLHCGEDYYGARVLRTGDT